jgi:hypothetical protein
MYWLRALSGMWIVGVLVGWSALLAGMEKHSIHWKGWEGLWIFILAIVLGGVLAAILYSLCLRALCRGTRHFHLVSLYPAALSIFPLIWISGLFITSEWWWVRMTTVTVFVLTLSLTIAGWWGRRPGLYLMALAAAGMPITMVGASLSVSLLNSRVVTGMDGIGTVLDFAAGCLTLAVGTLYVEAANAAAWLIRPGGTDSHIGGLSVSPPARVLSPRG